MRCLVGALVSLDPKVHVQTCATSLEVYLCEKFANP